MFIQASSLSAGDIILEPGQLGRGARKSTVQRRRFDNVGCSGVHVDIKGGGTWCYHRTAQVEVEYAHVKVAA